MPSFTIALAIYLAIGYGGEPTSLNIDTSALKAEVASHFDWIHPILFVVPLAVLVMVLMKVDALVALFVGTVLGGVFAIAFQPQMIDRVAGLEEVPVQLASDAESTTMRPQSYLKRSYAAFINAMAFKTKGIKGEVTEAAVDELAAAKLASARKQTSNPELTAEEFEKSDIVLEESFPKLEAKIAAADLLVGKGMAGMLNTIWLIITAMCFGGIMEACGLLKLSLIHI